MSTQTDSGFSLYWVVGSGAGQILALSTDTLSIGRKSVPDDGGLQIDDPTVSRHHAALEWQPSRGRFLYRHLSKTNPSRVDGVVVKGDVELGHSAQLAIGKSLFLLQHRWPATQLPTKERNFEYAIQLLPGGYSESLHMEEENRLGLHLSVLWEPRWNCFLASTDGDYKATITRRSGDRTYKLPFSKPTALELGDILEANFCQYLFTGQKAQTNRTSFNSLRNSKSLIPGYRRLRKLGQGNSSEVFLMLDPEGRKVAAKFLLPHLVHDPQARESFTKEGQVALTLNHPFLLDVLHVGTNDAEEKYIVSEFMEAGSLRHILNEAGPLALKKVLRLMGDVCSGLHFLHQQDLVHRDIKPANIFLCNKRSVVADFGIVKGLDLETATQSGYTLGTPHYMAPEHFRGVTEPRSDQYALAVVVVEALTGKLLFDAPDNMTIAHKHLHESPDRVDQLLSGFPQTLRSGLKRMLSKSPEDRFPSVIDALNFVVEA